jgi:hypothetical protein
VVSVDQERALAMLERGEIAAAVMVSGKPVSPLGHACASGRPCCISSSARRSGPKLFEDFQGWRVGEGKVQAEPAAAARDEPVSIEAAEPSQ